MGNGTGERPSRLESLTPDQEALISVYCEKWRRIALRCEPLDRQTACEAVRAIYALADLGEPEIVFCPSPYAATQSEIFQSGSEVPQAGTLWHRLSWALGDELARRMRRGYIERLRKQLEDNLKKHLAGQVWRSLENQLVATLDARVWGLSANSISPEGWTALCCYFDYCHTVLGCPHDRSQWQTFCAVVQSCGWLFPYRRVCLVSERPVSLHLDRRERLHAEGTPALRFADGFAIYSWHGVTLPESYGRVPPAEWRPHWILEENDAELRRVLIEGIGYERICRQLQARPLDRWREYSLLKVEHIDVEPVHLLQTSCPGTGIVQVLRVPPEFTTARTAAQWANRGTDPEEFLVQT
ncbi:MAG: hypothetical protein KME03_04625 [Aphanocapsa lilacina HA4352-LM1]|jgi:hypothetical protein|nr:hypothetical protein [Aphanocapsa lilacina HA4352-LM1]